MSKSYRYKGEKSLAPRKMNRKKLKEKQSSQKRSSGKRIRLNDQMYD